MNLIVKNDFICKFFEDLFDNKNKDKIIASHLKREEI